MSLQINQTNHIKVNDSAFMAGEYKWWHNNGQLAAHCFFVNGKLHGESKQWWANGNLMQHCHHDNGQLHGEYKTWQRNGELLDHRFFENGVAADKAIH